MLRQTYRGVSHRDWCRYSAQDVSRMEPHLDQVPHKHRPSVTKNTVRNLRAALVVEQHRVFGGRSGISRISTVNPHTLIWVPTVDLPSRSGTPQTQAPLPVRHICPWVATVIQG